MALRVCLYLLLPVFVVSSQQCSSYRTDSCMMKGGHIVFDTPTGTLGGRTTGNHIVILPPNGGSRHSRQRNVLRGGRGIGIAWKPDRPREDQQCQRPTRTIPSEQCFSPPGPPGYLSVRDATPTEIRLGWDVPESNGHVFKYEIQYGIIGHQVNISLNGTEEMTTVANLMVAAGDIVGSESSSSAEIVIRHLHPETTYRFIVRGYNFIGCGSSSVCIGNTTAYDMMPFVGFLVMAIVIVLLIGVVMAVFEYRQRKNKKRKIRRDNIMKRSLPKIPGTPDRYKVCPRGPMVIADAQSGTVHYHDRTLPLPPGMTTAGVDFGGMYNDTAVNDVMEVYEDGECDHGKPIPPRLPPKPPDLPPKPPDLPPKPVGINKITQRGRFPEPHTGKQQSMKKGSHVSKGDFGGMYDDTEVGESGEMYMVADCDTSNAPRLPLKPTDRGKAMNPAPIVGPNIGQRQSGEKGLPIPGGDFGGTYDDTAVDQSGEMYMVADCDTSNAPRLPLKPKDYGKAKGPAPLFGLQIIGQCHSGDKGLPIPGGDFGGVYDDTAIGESGEMYMVADCDTGNAPRLLSKPKDHGEAKGSAPLIGPKIIGQCQSGEKNLPKPGGDFGGIYDDTEVNMPENTSSVPSFRAAVDNVADFDQVYDETAVPEKRGYCGSDGYEYAQQGELSVDDSNELQPAKGQPKRSFVAKLFARIVKFKNFGRTDTAVNGDDSAKRTAKLVILEEDGGKEVLDDAEDIYEDSEATTALGYSRQVIPQPQSEAIPDFDDSGEVYEETAENGTEDVYELV